jgi:hypothetical protein
MVDPEIKQKLEQFFLSARADRKDAPHEKVSKELRRLQLLNSISNTAVTIISNIFADELELRSLTAWKSIKFFFERGNITFDKKDAGEIEELLQQLVISEEIVLLNEIENEFGGMYSQFHFKRQDLAAIASSKEKIFPKITAELNFYTDFNLTKNDVSTKVREKDNYVDKKRIEELKNIVNKDFDLTRLIKLCEEINVAHQNDCFMSIAMIMRAIIDHIPPIFKVSKFTGVANNYGGSPSFKDSMKLLGKSLRKIADSHLHIQIRRRETLPTFTQVNFKADLDLLLSEIVRLLK